jgi:outer membrane protein assembly factor BamB
MKKFLITLIALLLATPLFFGCDPNRNVPISLKWRFETGYDKNSSSSLTVVDGVVYSGGLSEYIYAIDKDTGELKWKYYEKKAEFTSPSVANGVVYVGRLNKSTDLTHYLYAIDASSGKLMWRTKLSEPIYAFWSGSPTVSDGIVYIGSVYKYLGNVDDYLYAIDAVNGEIQWCYKFEGTIENFPPLVADGVVYFAGGEDYGDNLYAINAENGEFMWQCKADTIKSTPTAVDGLIYAGISDGYLYALDAKSGELKWSFETENHKPATSPSIVDGVLYEGTWDGYLYTININSGKLKWRFRTQFSIWSTPLVVDDLVYIGSEEHYLYALDSHTGMLKWKYKTGGAIFSSIIFIDGVIYFVSRDGYLYALEMKK